MLPRTALAISLILLTVIVSIWCVFGTYNSTSNQNVTIISQHGILTPVEPETRPSISILVAKNGLCHSLLRSWRNPTFQSSLRILLIVAVAYLTYRLYCFYHRLLQPVHSIVSEPSVSPDVPTRLTIYIFVIFVCLFLYLTALANSSYDHSRYEWGSELCSKYPNHPIYPSTFDSLDNKGNLRKFRICKIDHCTLLGKLIDEQRLMALYVNKIRAELSKRSFTAVSSCLYRDQNLSLSDCLFSDFPALLSEQIRELFGVERIILELFMDELQVADSASPITLLEVFVRAARLAMNGICLKYTVSAEFMQETGNDVCIGHLHWPVPSDPSPTEISKIDIYRLLQSPGKDFFVYVSEYLLFDSCLSSNNNGNFKSSLEYLTETIKSDSAYHLKEIILGGHVMSMEYYQQRTTGGVLPSTSHGELSIDYQELDLLIRRDLGSSSPNRLVLFLLFAIGISIFRNCRYDEY